MTHPRWKVTLVMCGVLFAETTVVVPAGGKGLLDKVEKGKGVITGVVEVLTWIKNAYGKQSISLEWPLDGTTELELGLSMKVPFKVKYTFEDSLWGVGDYAFVEIYVLLNNNLLYFKRYPETGFIEDPNAWFDDSKSEELKEAIWNGAHDWPCDILNDDLVVKAFLWQDTSGTLDGARWSGQIRDENGVLTNHVGMWVEGRGLFEWARYKPGMLTKLDEAELTTQLRVPTPYFVQKLESDDGTTKNHHDQPFIHDFKVNMAYTLNYPNLTVRNPETPVDVVVNGLDSHLGWIWITPSPLRFQFNAGVQRIDSREFNYVGLHGVEADHHPNVTVEYDDDWGADESGQNIIFFGGSEPTVETATYTFATKFRRQPQGQAGCTPIPFGVSCEDPHGQQPPPGSPMLPPWFVLLFTTMLAGTTWRILRRHHERSEGAS
jgi:hypothetical protein